ncbi:MAG: rod shape-determining protein MreC [Woeseiaceae bacterium]|jgi:rod shape-determining protein MreC|nr:rod shape-determining protein MreC [Woeseiaceae bacterium]
MAAAKSNQQFHSAFSPALGLRFLLLAGLSLLLLVIDHRDNHLGAVRKAVGAAVYPLRIIVDAPVSIWRWTVDTTASRNELQLENSRLNAERLLTQARLQRYSSLEAENARLRTMLEARATVREQVRVAEILSVSSDPFRHLLVVDKGSVDNVYDGQVVIDANGVVGQVIKAGVLSSQCMLISDPGHALPVEVNRNGLRTIARGTGEFDKLDLPFLPNNADIEPGDLLVTSGRGGAFPAGYPVAIVDSVIRIPQEPFASVTATPAASLNQVREVMLIWSAPQESKESVEVTPAEASDSVDEEADEQSNE